MDEDGPGSEVAALRAEVAALRGRIEELAGLLTAQHGAEMGLLRRMHRSSAVYLGDHTALTFLANGCRLFLDTRDRAVGLSLLLTGSWEPTYTEAFTRLLRPGAAVVDVGANLGWYTLVSAQAVGREGRVFAVEPNPRMAQLLRESARANNFHGHVTVFQAALSDRAGVVDLLYRQESPGGAQIRPAELALGPFAAALPSVRVASQRLDELLAGHAGPVDVMEMDVEGWEGVALQGATALLDRSPGLRLMVEWGPGQDQTLVPRAAMAEAMAARGYLPFRIGLNSALVPESWEGALAERQLTNLVLLRGEDPLAR
jgi:FkbM family methyltransferase